MDQEKQVPRDEILQREINQLRNESSRSSATIYTLSQELIFWKKLSLSNLGVDSQKINELVMYGANSISSGPGAVSRGY